MKATSHIVTPHLSLIYNRREFFRKLLKNKNGMIERILIKIRGIPPNVTENLRCALMGGAPLVCHLVLVMTLSVRSKSALLDFLTSSSLLSGKESIASAAMLACFLANSLALCIPRLLPR